MTGRITRRQLFAYAAFVAVLFVCNGNHQTQQSVYHDSIEYARGIVERGTYSISDADPSPRFYPMWGVPGFLLLPAATGIDPVYFTLFIQWLLCLICIVIVYEIADVEPRWWHALLLLPWILLMSVKWGDAIASGLMLLAVWFLDEKGTRSTVVRLVLAGVTIGIAAQFRPEAALWPVVLLLVLVLSRRGHDSLPRIGSALIVIASTAAIMMPWALRSATSGVVGAPLFGSSNSGAVMYISLGQLDDNPWGIIHTDEFALRIARDNGISDPWSPEANAFFTRAAVDSMSARPFAALRKMLWNAGRGILGGFYVGEWPALVVTKDEWATQQFLAGERSYRELFARLSVAGGVLWLIQILLRAASCGLLFLLLLWASRESLARYMQGLTMFEAAVIALVLSHVAIIALFQYESRHMNALLPVLLAWMGGKQKQNTGDRIQKSEVET